MTISELIAQLQDIEDVYGDLHVEHSTGHLVHSAVVISNLGKKDDDSEAVAVRLS